MSFTYVSIVFLTWGIKEIHIAAAEQIYAYLAAVDVRLTSDASKADMSEVLSTVLLPGN